MPACKTGTIAAFSAALALSTFVTMGWSTTAVAAEKVACGTKYTIKSGDTLSKLANAVEPPLSSYQKIITFNPGKIRDPNLIYVGLELQIPCEDGTIVVTDKADPTDTETESSSDARIAATDTTGKDNGADVARNARVDILTGSAYPPYVDRDLPHRGFSTHVIDSVFGDRASGVSHRIDIIDDWSSHLRVLLALGKYDLAYPWFRPDCARREKLGDEGKWRCDNLRFSAPLHEVVVSYYARTEDAPAISSASSLKGKRICRPEGYFTHDLAVRDLLPPNTERAAPKTPTDCFKMRCGRCCFCGRASVTSWP